MKKIILLLLLVLFVYACSTPEMDNSINADEVTNDVDPTKVKPPTGG